MRKLILIAAMSLLASQAYAGGSRSLSLAATNASPQATEQPAAAAAVTPQTPPAASQPGNAQTATTAPTSAPTATTSPAATAPAAQSTAGVSTAGTAKPKRRQPSVEARVVRELHRHGIYW